MVAIVLRISFCLLVQAVSRKVASTATHILMVLGGPLPFRNGWTQLHRISIGAVSSLSEVMQRVIFFPGTTFDKLNANLYSLKSIWQSVKSIVAICLEVKVGYLATVGY